MSLLPLSLLALVMPLSAMASSFGWFGCPTLNTDPVVASSTGLATLAALGPLKLVLENGTPTERGRTCNTLTLDAAAGTYTYTYWSSGSSVTESGSASFLPGPPSLLTLDGLTPETLGSGRSRSVELSVISVDEAEVVLVACNSVMFFFHNEHSYVFSKYAASEFDDSCAISTISSKLGRTVAMVGSQCSTSPS